MLSYLMSKKKIGFKRFSKNIILLTLILTFFYLLITVPFFNKIYPNIYIGNIYLGNKSEQEAELLLSNKTQVPEKIKFKINNHPYEILTSEIDLSYDFKASVKRALNYPNKLKLIFKPVNLGLILKIDRNKLTESLLIISSKESVEAVKPSAKIINGQLLLDYGKNGTQIDIKEIENKILSNISLQINEEPKFATKEVNVQLDKNEAEKFRNRAQKLLDKEIILTFEDQKIIISGNDILKTINAKDGYNIENIRNQIEKTAREINRHPQDSVFIIENGNVKEFTPSKDGVTINEDKLLQNIQAALDDLLTTDKKSMTFEIPVITYPAKIKNEDVNNLGIKTLLGRGDSSFKGSINNRVYNINLAQSKFKGVLIPPNEEVSFNKILGDVSSLTGYKAAYVIKDGRTVLGDGGGVCQVSTTLFRALLNAGLPITERRAHAYRVGYYEQGFPPGLDATVYYPTTDLKFKNDTPAYILIQPTIDLQNSKLKFEIYGTNDGRVANISKPIITSQIAPPEDLYIDDPTLAAGTIKQIEHKAWGAKVVFDYKVTRGEEILIDQKFVSNYRAWGAVYLRGIAQ